MLAEFARLLGIPLRQSEDALHSEPAAKLVVSRRLFIGASAAGAAALMLNPDEVERAMVTSCSRTARAQRSSLHLVDSTGRILRRWYPGETVSWINVCNDAEKPMVARVVRVGFKGVDNKHSTVLLQWWLQPAVRLQDGKLLSSSLDYLARPDMHIIA